MRYFAKASDDTADQKSRVSFLALINAISETGCLHLTYLNQPSVVQRDASSYGVDPVFLQELEGVLCPLVFASHTMTSPERNYIVAKQEVLCNHFSSRKVWYVLR